jgi:hypothetical protein
MDDDFYEPLSHATAAAQASGLVSSAWKLLLSTPFSFLLTVLLAPLVIVIATRLLSGHPPAKCAGREERSVWMMPYWVPVVGHTFQLQVTKPVIVDLTKKSQPL